MKSERILDLPHAVNLRELGGYQNINNQTIKWRKLLRSGELSRLNEHDGAVLADYGLKYDIDLRSPSEVTWSPDRVPTDIIVRSYPVYPIHDGETSDIPVNQHLQYQSHVEAMYDPYLVMVLNEHARLAFRQMFIDLLANDQENESLLFHCAAGKDRTGVAGMLIMAALQVPYSTIREDYLLTNLVYSRRDPDELRKQIANRHANQLIQRMNNVFSVAASSLDRAHQLIIDRFGNWDHYFKEALELSETDLQDLRRLYLE